MKLLLTGLNGFVAGSIVAHSFKKWEVHGVDLSPSSGLPSTIKSYQIDLLDNEKVKTLFHEIKPDAVIHTAAIANIDTCQNNQLLAEKVNVGITQTIADLCREFNAKMIFCSTDSIFDGLKGFYSEEDQPKAINFYAETKVKAEKIVLEASTKNVVARLSLVMGLPVVGKGNSFLADTIEKLKAGEPVKFPSNEIRTPIDVVTLGSALTELAGNDFGGVVHLAGNTRINRYEMAIYIAQNLGFNPDLIIPTDSNAMEGRAPRPNDASMVNTLAAKILKTPMLSLADGLKNTLTFKMEEQ